MPSTASIAILGTGICPYCSEPNVLYTHSLEHTMPQVNWTGNEAERLYAGCRSCERTNIRNTTRYASGISQEMIDELGEIEQLLVNANTSTFLTSDCESCDQPLLDSSSLDRLLEPYTQTHYTPVEARTGIDDEIRTIIVHRRCSHTTSCCDIVLSNSSHEPLVTIYNRDTSLCRLCLVAEMTERGHNFEDDYFLCNGCDIYHHNVERRNFHSRRYCDNCYNNNVGHCGDCDTDFWTDDYHNCQEESESVILEYSYKPRPVFFGKNFNPKERLFFGLELEVESVRGDREDNAEVVKQLLGDRVYLKEDGSLNNGFEIVSHPHSLEAFRKEFNWESFARFRNIGLRSWDTSTCGIHIHISRDAFGPAYDTRTGEPYDPWGPDTNHAETQAYYRTRQTHELKFIKLIYDNDRQVSRLAGRYSEEYANFTDKGSLTRKVRRGETSGGRHSAVNTENDRTLEVRVFRGSLAPERVLAHLEFVHSAVEYTRDLKVSGNTIPLGMGKVKPTALTWLAYSSYVYTHSEQYPNLTSLMVRTFDRDNLEE